ncbi:NADH-FMN oxidoreductase RutF, flavin reductase (DIM6/NTAB) family [Rhizobiales bacterium GAS188]|nr:NADH-FMN oxidoreductase RutF, flavin reductase (DIM6/NTAB) family [Rhizobiales bacterium GAS188]
MGIAIRDLSLAQAQPLQELFRSAMRGLAGAVSIITVGTDEDRTGLTATSVSSLSVEPPSLIVSVNRNSSSWSALKRDGSFAVNILQARHAAIAERFSGRGGLKGAARYDGASWITLATGAPILEDALAAFDCEVEEMIERHSHAIVIGKVVAVRLAEEAEPLIYWRGGYLPISPT